VVSGFSVKGKPVSVQVDTLYSGTMLIYSASVAKLSFTPDATAKKRFFPFIDGGVQMIEAPQPRRHSAAISPEKHAHLFPHSRRA
jgi:hypothetical protein